MTFAKHNRIYRDPISLGRSGLGDRTPNMASPAEVQNGLARPSLARCKRDIGAAPVKRGPYVSLIELGNEPRHVEWLGPRI